MLFFFVFDVFADPWETARNLVFHASEHLRRGCIWLAEFIRYRVKTNANIVFKAAVREFEETAHYEENDLITRNDEAGISGTDQHEAKSRLEWTRQRNKTDDKMIRLLKIGKMDYDKVVDWLVNDFIDTIEKIPHDQTECLNKRFVDDAMRYSRALNSLWDYAVRKKFSHEDRTQYNWEGISGGKPPPQLTNQALNSSNGPPLQLDDGKSNRNEKNPNDSNSQSQAQTKASKPNSTRTNQNGKAAAAGRPRLDSHRHHAHERGNKNYVDPEIARPAGLRDVFFYKFCRSCIFLFVCLFVCVCSLLCFCVYYRTLYPAKQDYEFNMKYENDVHLIYNLARVQWAAVKHHVISSVQQQMSHRIMKEITFQSGKEQFSEATLRGFDRPQVSNIINKLTKRTNIPASHFELLIEQAPIPASKAVMQMTDDELLSIYGAELKEKQKLYQELVQEYKEFLDAKKIAELKIEEVKEMEVL